MSRTERRKVGRLRGRGKVYADDKFIASATYDLDEYQDFVIIQHSDGKDELPGHSSHSGTVQVTSGESDLFFVERRLVLGLDDGRGIEILVRRWLGPSSCSVLTSGDFIPPDQMPE